MVRVWRLFALLHPVIPLHTGEGQLGLLLFGCHIVATVQRLAFGFQNLFEGLFQNCMFYVCSGRCREECAKFGLRGSMRQGAL